MVITASDDNNDYSDGDNDNLESCGGKMYARALDLSI